MPPPHASTCLPPSLAFPTYHGDDREVVGVQVLDVPFEGGDIALVEPRPLSRGDFLASDVDPDAGEEVRKEDDSEEQVKELNVVGDFLGEFEANLNALEDFLEIACAYEEKQEKDVEPLSVSTIVSKVLHGAGVKYECDETEHVLLESTDEIVLYDNCTIHDYESVLAKSSDKAHRDIQ